MTNEDVYAGGLLARALDPATQPEAIRDYLQAEYDLLERLVEPGARVLDVGCGMGRHLHALAERLALGAGVDYERASIREACRRRTHPHLHFVAADATAIPFAGPFDLTICMTNTWGTMERREAVLDEMRRLAPEAGSRLLSVYSPASVPARRAWYERLGQSVRRESVEALETDGGFRSEHFAPERVRRLVGECEVSPVSAIGLIVRF